MCGNRSPEQYRVVVFCLNRTASKMANRPCHNFSKYGPEGGEKNAFENQGNYCLVLLPLEAALALY